MRIAAIALFLAVTAACAAAKPKPQKTTVAGRGFYCAVGLCLRTMKACNVLEKETGATCERRDTAFCFIAEDEHNMRTWMVCYTSPPGCEKGYAETKEPGSELRWTPCHLKQ